MYDKDNNKVNLSSTLITTNCKVKLNSTSYLVVINGDVNADGKVSDLDVLEIKNHIMGNTIKDKGRLSAGDIDSNNKVSSLDYIKLKNRLGR